MLVRLFGRMILVRDLQPANAKFPMLARLLGSVMLVRYLHS